MNEGGGREKGKGREQGGKQGVGAAGSCSMDGAPGSQAHDLSMPGDLSHASRQTVHRALMRGASGRLCPPHGAWGHGTCRRLVHEVGKPMYGYLTHPNQSMALPCIGGLAQERRA